MPEARPDRQQILEMMNGFRAACVTGAAAELNVWTALGEQSLTAEQLAEKLGCDRRAITMLLDAVVALELLDKQGGRYLVPAELRGWLVEGAPQSVLPMLWHVTNVLRSWSQLAATVKEGAPAARQASVRGAEADRAAFIAAMHAISGPDGRRLGGAAWPAQVSTPAGRRRGIRHVDPGLSPRRACGDGHDLRSARRHPAGPPAVGRHGVRRVRDVGGGRFLRRRIASRRRFCLGQRHLPSAFAAGEPRTVRQGMPRRLCRAGGSPFATW